MNALASPSANSGASINFSAKGQEEQKGIPAPFQEKAKEIPPEKKEDQFIKQLQELKEEKKEIGKISMRAGPSTAQGGSKRVDIDFEHNLEEKGVREEIEEIHKYQQQLIDRKQKIEARAWDLKFQKYWGIIVNADKNYEESIKYSERLIDHEGKFRRTATFYTKLIINELHKPKEKRTFRAIKQLDTITKLFCDDDPAPTVYVINSMIFKMTTKSSVITRNIGEETFVEYKWKAFGREFHSLDIMFDALFILSRPRADYNLRVPLCCLVDYKGFRTIVYGLMPLNEALDPVLGLGADGTYHEASLQGVARQMPYLAEVLNLKDHNFYFKNATQAVHVALSPLIEVHRRDNTKMNSEDEADTGEFSEKKKEMDFHIYELDYDEDVYYLLKTSEIFPVDYSLQDRKPFDIYLRPEFVCKFEKPLRADAQKRRIRILSQFVDYESSDDGQLEIGEAKQQLLSGVIPRVVEQFDSLSIIPIDSITMTKVMNFYIYHFRHFIAKVLI